MEIDRTKITPEMLVEMRSILVEYGIYPDKLTSDQIITSVELLLGSGAMIEVSEHIRETISKLTFVVVKEFTQAIRRIFLYQRRSDEMDNNTFDTLLDLLIKEAIKDREDVNVRGFSVDARRGVAQQATKLEEARLWRRSPHAQEYYESR